MATLAAPFDVPMKPGLEIRIAMAAVKCYRGGAAAVALGTGNATPLVVTTIGHQFIGVFEETFDNSAGSAGGAYVRVARSGIFAFNQTGILQASVGQRAYFSDDNTITTTVGQNFAGIIVAIDQQNSVAWVDIEPAIFWPTGGPPGGITVQGAAAPAIAPHVPQVYVFNRAGVTAATLAAPTAGVDDGLQITITSDSAQAHTLTATGLLDTGSASVNLATFAANKGSGLTLMAYNGRWKVMSATGITFS